MNKIKDLFRKWFSPTVESVPVADNSLVESPFPELTDSDEKRRELAKAHFEQLVRMLPELSDDHIRFITSLVENQIEFVLSPYNDSKLSVNQSIDIAAKAAMILIPQIELIGGFQPITRPREYAYYLRKVADGEAAGEMLLHKAEMEATTKKLHSSLEMDSSLSIEVDQSLSHAMADLIASDLLNYSLHTIASKTQRFYFNFEDHRGTDEQKNGVLVSEILALTQSIGDSTNRGPGNFVLCNKVIADRLASAANSKFVHSNTAEHEAQTSIRYYGTIDGKVDVLLYNTKSPPATNTISVLVGYRGKAKGQTDVGYILSPYIMMMSAGVEKNDTTFSNVHTLMSRYADFVSPEFFRIIDVERPAE